MAGSFGDRLRTARKRVGLSGPELARRLGVSSQTVSEWERDKYQPKGDRLSAIAQLTQTKVDWLLSGGNEEERPVVWGGGRLVPKIALQDLGKYDPRKPGPIARESVLSHFPCGQNSFQITIADTANSPRIMPGDSVIIDPDLTPRPGDLVLMIVEGHPVLRKYLPRKKQINLEPYNQDWETISTVLGKGSTMLGTMTEHSQPRR